jgi:hypothetical protein
MKPGPAARVDYEYERNGTANLLMLFAPLEGWRHIKVTAHTAVDYAHVLKDLADIHFPHKRTIVLVQDNLNIHSKGSLYEAFPPAEARRLVERFEWHYTPKHGSWLDLAESDPGVLSAQCLDPRIRQSKHHKANDDSGCSRAGPFPLRISVSSCWRSSLPNSFTVVTPPWPGIRDIRTGCALSVPVFTEISFLAMILSIVRIEPRPKRIMTRANRPAPSNWLKRATSAPRVSYMLYRRQTPSGSRL